MNAMLKDTPWTPPRQHNHAWLAQAIARNAPCRQMAQLNAVSASATRVKQNVVSSSNHLTSPANLAHHFARSATMTEMVLVFAAAASQTTLV